MTSDEQLELWAQTYARGNIAVVDDLFFRDKKIRTSYPLWDGLLKIQGWVDAHSSKSNISYWLVARGHDDAESRVLRSYRNGGAHTEIVRVSNLHVTA